jgi:hypothetical protein
VLGLALILSSSGDLRYSDLAAMMQQAGLERSAFYFLLGNGYFSESRIRTTSESVWPRISASLLPSNDQ